MRKLLVRIFNLVYLAAAVFAILSLCFEPLFKLSLDVNIKNSDLVALVQTQNTNNGTENSGNNSSENENNTKKIIEQIGDIQTEEPLVIEIPAKVYFDFKNQEVLKDVINENIDHLTLQLSKLLGSKLKQAIKAFAISEAKTILNDQISRQIASYYTGEGSAPIAKQEDVNQIVDNVYALFESQEETTTADLTNTIMGQRTYSLAEPQPTSLDDLKDKAYYYKVGEGEEAEYIRDYGDEAEFVTRKYYTVEFDTGVCSILKDLEGTEGFENVDYDKIDGSSIESAMIESLESMPGLTDARYTLVEMNLEKFEAKAEDYYIIDENENYVLATEYVEGKDYFTKEVIIKNVDDALAALMDSFFPGGSPKAIIKRGETPELTAEEESELEKKVQQMLKNLIKADTISEFAEKTVTQYTPLALTGILVIFAFPWVWFAVKTLIRTLRKRKCWCKFSVVFIFAFIQLILGAVVTLGLRFGFNKILEVVSSSVPDGAAPIVNVLSSCRLKIQFGCLMASYVYIGMVVTGIVYAIIAHRIKIDYKYDKKHAKREKKAAKRAKRRANAELAQ